VVQPNDESPRIRPLGPEDAEKLGDLFDELAADPEALHFHPHPLTRAEATRIATRSGIREDLYFAAFVESRLAGYGMLRGWDEGYDIPSFGVAVGVGDRGSGLGRSLLRYAISAARRRGAQSMILKVHPSNAGALHIYESEGFVFDETPVGGGQMKGRLRL
jgi:ribosomal protein S18 acetylase RimI-like enzyme